MKRFRILVVAFWVLGSLPLFAVMATKEPIEVTQPDGTKLTLYLHGDEYNNYLTDAQGVPMRQLENGVYVQDRQMRQAVGMQRPAQRAPQAVQASFPLKGEIRSVVILVNFSDLSFVTPNANAEFTRLLNEQGYSDNGGTGSARDYFLASSMNQFQPTFDVYGPYTLAHPMKYYGERNGDYNDRNASEMIKEACRLAEYDGVDFSQYDLDNNGVVDNIFVYYAGHNEAEGGGANTIWPHRSAVWNSPTYSGKQIYDYACTSELKGSSGSRMCAIGTFCHEFGHVLGLPDMYHTESSDTYTVGDWDIMCSGSYNNGSRTPPVYTAFERFMLGWSVPEQLDTIGPVLVEPLETSNKAYLVAVNKHNLLPKSPNPAEYFLIENRQQVGWDAPDNCLPGTGLLISHITFTIGAYTNNTFNNGKPLGFDIVEAHGQTTYYSTAADTYPGLNGITVFTPVLNNGTILAESRCTGIMVNPDLSVTFQYGMPAGTGFELNPESFSTFTTTYDRRIKESEIQELTINGTKLPADSVIISLSNRNFEIGVDSVWLGAGKSFVDTVRADSTYHRVIQLRHTPSRQNCKTLTTILRVSTSDNIIQSQMSLVGTAPRPIYITEVKSLPATDITPYMFTANWEQQTDAENYYLTLYQLLENPSKKVQGFEQFDTPTAVQAAGWSSNFLNLVTNPVQEGQRALLFRTTGDMLYSEKYPMPVTELSVWVSNTYSNVAGQETGGTLEVTAFDGEDNEFVLETLKTTRNTKDLTLHYTFEEASNYRYFRIAYTHKGGNGGVVIDNFTAQMTHTLKYLYQGEDLPLYADNETEYRFSGLTPGDTYYYQVQCSEEKGCEKHYSPISDVVSVTLPWGTDNARQFTIAHRGEDGLVAYFPTTPNAEKKIFLYSVAGQLLTVIDLPTDGVGSIDLPTADLEKGKLYLAKYCYEDQMKRKDLYAKFIY